MMSLGLHPLRHNLCLHCHCFYTTADDKPVLDDLLCMSYTGWDGRDTRFRLMHQLHPYWRRLAVALKFHQCDIAAMEHKDDPVFHLLSEWLQGANQERDSRPVTWGTLITALRDANIQELANMLEKEFVKIKEPIVHVAMSQVESELMRERERERERESQVHVNSFVC